MSVAPTEHRLALVMNGGVSLAVWMGGVAHEIDTLRRASNGLVPPRPGWAGDRQADAERRLYRRWAEVTAAAGTRFTVDVISGTSAGGLNGVLLATAIGKGIPLGGLRDLWLAAPGLTEDRLLKPQEGPPLSGLNGDYFHDEIRAALGRLTRDAATAAESGVPDDRGRDVDVSLTVTATGLGGEPRIVRDRNGVRFVEQDHRRRYGFRRVSHAYTYGGAPGEFSSRPCNDFTEDEALGLMARATASFPGAFAPVAESEQLRDRRVWPTWRTGDGPEYLADGGLLDNSPFDSVLDEIAAQPVDAPWRRTVCFIVPSSDEIGHPLRPGPMEPPPWTSVVEAAIGDPREANLRDDIETMHDLMRSSRATYDVRRLRLLLAPPPADLPPGELPPFETATLLATSGFRLYQQARRAATLYDAQDVAADALPEAFISPIVDFTSADVRGDRDWVPDRFPTELPDRWTWGVAAAARVVALLVRSLADRLDVPDSLRATLSDIGLQVSAVGAAVDRSIGDAVRAHPAGTEPWSPAPGEVATMLDAAYDRLQVPAALAPLVTAAVTAYAGGVRREDGSGRDPLDVLQAAVCVEVVNGAGGDPLGLRSRPKFDFLRLGIGQQPPMFDAAFGGPPDGPQPPKSDILYGSRLSHFAAFGRASWREWDWMWGRIHATVQLVSLLGLDPDAAGALIDELTALVVEAEGADPDEVARRIPDVLGLDPRDLLRAMAEDGTVQPTIRAVLDLLASDAVTVPRTPGVVTGVGRAVAPIEPLISRAIELWCRFRR